MMNGEGLLQIVAQMISALIGMDVPSMELNLISEGMIDSLVLVQLVLGIEERFGVQIALDDLEFENFESVRSIADLVSAKAEMALVEPAGAVT